MTKRQGGTTRYRVMVDGGISPSGVAWERIVPSDDELANLEAKMEMNESARGFGYEPPPPTPQPPPPTLVSSDGVKRGKKLGLKSKRTS